MNDNKEDIEKKLPNANEIEDIRNALIRLEHSSFDVDSEWEEMSKRIDEDTSFGKKLWARALILTVAAVALVVILFVYTNKQSYSPQEVFLANDAPSNVTIKTGNAKPQIVEKSTISFAGKDFTSSKKNVMIEITTPRGKDRRVLLPDGTEVWLNAESQLSFPSAFTGERRLVKLRGEAYFNVAHDEKHPFTVETDRTCTTARGTSFNINAYPSNKSENVVLVEGVVTVCSRDGHKVHGLRPGQIAQFKDDDIVHISQIDTYPYTQRKEGFFYFDRQTLLDIMVELGRWYNKTIVFETEAAMHQQLHFVAERNQNLQTIMESLNEIDGVEIEIHDNEVLVR